jgi:hypothetical protein
MSSTADGLLAGVWTRRPVIVEPDESGWSPAGARTASARLPAFPTRDTPATESSHRCMTESSSDQQVRDHTTKSSATVPRSAANSIPPIFAYPREDASYDWPMAPILRACQGEHRTLPRGVSLAALCLRVRPPLGDRLAGPRRVRCAARPDARPTPTRRARLSGRLTALSPHPPDVGQRGNGGSVPRPSSQPALGRVDGRWAGSDVWQLGLVAERDDVLG